MDNSLQNCHSTTFYRFTHKFIHREIESLKSFNGGFSLCYSSFSLQFFSFSIFQAKVSIFVLSLWQQHLEGQMPKTFALNNCCSCCSRSFGFFTWSLRPTSRNPCWWLWRHHLWGLCVCVRESFGISSLGDRLFSGMY